MPSEEQDKSFKRTMKEKETLKYTYQKGSLDKETRKSTT